MPRSRAKEEITQIPSEYEDQGEAWAEAYTRAYAMGCSEKAAILYAEAHWADFESGVDSLPDDTDILKARIAELEAKVTGAS